EQHHLMKLCIASRQRFLHISTTPCNGNNACAKKQPLPERNFEMHLQRCAKQFSPRVADKRVMPGSYCIAAHFLAREVDRFFLAAFCADPLPQAQTAFLDQRLWDVEESLSHVTAF